MSRPCHQFVVAAGGASGSVVLMRRHAIVNATATSSISGTATRSARATARGPRQTISVATMPSAIAHADFDAVAPSVVDTPATRTHADAAITLFNAIHAKFDRYSTRATSPAPPIPSAGR